MRDRTIILIALLFLVLSIGAGVNRSLVAGNKMLGKQMAPSFDQIYQHQAPVILEGVKVMTEYGRARGLEASRQLPVVARELKVLQVTVKQRLTAVLTKWRSKWSETVSRIKANTIAEKNRIIQ